MHRLGEALASYDRVIKLEPNRSHAYSGRGRALAEVERWEEARTEFEAALRKDPSNAEAIEGLSLLPDGLLPRQKALELLGGLDLSCSKDDAAASLFMKARLLKHLQEHEKSFECLRQANRIRLADKTKELRSSNLQIKELLAEIASWKPTTFTAQPTVKQKLLVVLGPSRAGKTLLEDLICGNRSVYRGFEGEFLTLPRIMLDQIHSDRRNNCQFAPLDGSRKVLEALFPLTHDDSVDDRYTIITITNPYLLAVAHRIHDAFSQSYFVFLSRDAIDNAAEIFSKDYKSKSSFAYCPNAALSYVKDFHEVSQLLLQKLGLRALEVSYESVLKSPGVTSDAIYQRLGLVAPSNIKIDAAKGKADDVSSKYREYYIKMLDSRTTSAAASA